MADTTTELYRFTGTRLRRDGADREAGYVFEPTDAELSAFGDLLERVSEGAVRAEQRETEDASREADGEDQNDAGDDESDSGDETTEDTSEVEDSQEDADTDDTADADTDAESDELSPDAAQELLADYMDDPTDYAELRTLATETDGVPGSGLDAEAYQVELGKAVRDGRLSQE